MEQVYGVAEYPAERARTAGRDALPAGGGLAADMARLNGLEADPYAGSSTGSGWRESDPGYATPAGFWIRVGAYLIDSVILIIPTLIVTQIATGLAGPELIARTDVAGNVTYALNGGSCLLHMILGYLLPSLYFGAFWTTRGQSPGMMAVGIGVRSAAGGPLSWGQTFGRVLLLSLSFACLGLGVLWVAFRDDKRGWHDLGCGSEVIRIA
jgi:uncharacterized RDD family membrane protein YckC